MRTIIIYYSLDGNTEFVARKVAQDLNASLLKLEPEKEYPKGSVSKYVWGGKSVVFGEKPRLKPYNFQKEMYDVIILATPIWASGFTPPIRSFLTTNDLINKKIGLISCSAGGDTQKCRQQILELTKASAFLAELNLIEPLKMDVNIVNHQILEFCTKLHENFG